MKIVFDSELMENQKHAVVMAPDLAFEALQSQNGDSLFFSIGTDKTFYVTRELTETSTGWNKIDLSSALASQHGGATVAAKTFAVTQNPQTLSIDLALVVTVGGEDYLYLSLRNANTDEAWAKGVAWTLVPFDAGAAPSPLTIADVLIMNLPGSSGAVENIFVDVARDPKDPLALLDRYYITPGGSPHWNLHVLAADLAAGSISSCLGQRTNDPTPGIYTFGEIGGQPELMFTPQYNYVQPKEAPKPARFTLPAGASAVASALNSSGVSNLFLAATDGLYVFAPDNQHDKAAPVQIVSASIVRGASSLAAATDANRTAVWGLGPQGSLFYVVCPAGREADPTAWSTPVPLVQSTEGFAFFLNLHAGNSVLFAHVEGNNLIQLSQDPNTTDWVQRAILLPPTSTSDMVVFKSFTTHVRITDDSGIGVPNAAVQVTATSPVSVYLNDVYHVLSPTVPVSAAADTTGVVTVVQETQSLAAVCFKLALADHPDVVANVNPMSKALATLSTVQSGPDLDKVQVTNADGTQQPLVPAGVASGDTDAAAQSIAQFAKINSSLPADGSRQSPAPARLAAAAPAPGLTVPPLWGVSFADGRLTYHEGPEAPAQLGLRALPSTAPGPLAAGDDWIEVAAGDLFAWLKDAFDDVEKFFVTVIDDIYHFVVTIAGEIYHAVLDCIAAVVHAVEFVFNKIKVFFEDLIKWLGFLFQWPDIVRTHRVMKNILNQYIANRIANLDDLKGDVKTAFTDAETYIANWAGIPPNIPPSLSDSTKSGTAGSNPPPSGLDSPQSNWGVHHLKGNAASAGMSTNSGVSPDGDILQPLIDAIDREKDVIESAFDSFKTDIIDKFDQLSFEQVVEAAIAIILDALLESVENVVLAAIDVLAELAEGILEALNATIDIPIISWIYKEVSGDDLSLLDVACLVAAIPVTIVYKLITDTAPFPDNATTQSLIDAPDFETIRRICNPASAPAPTATQPQLLGAPADIDPVLNKQLGLAGGILSLFGAICCSILGPLKLKFKDSGQILGVISALNGVCYLTYVAPDIMGDIPDVEHPKWWADTNTALAGLMVIKAGVDVATTTKAGAQQSGFMEGWNNASPWVDFGANIAWQVPTTAAIIEQDNWNTIGILNFWGGTCFDCNGMMSPALADDEDPVTWGIAVVAATILNLAYGAMSCAASALAFKQPIVASVAPASGSRPGGTG